MNNIKAGADIHAGDGGYRLGTKEGYDAFVKKRNPMNERIKQLAEQAGAIGYDDDGNELTPVLVGKDLEKFAELIVKECANHCDLLLDHKISSEWSRGTHDCSRAIKKHFGVEE